MANPARSMPGQTESQPAAPEGVCGVMVCFDPAPSVLTSTVAAAREQLDRIVVVDNSPDASGQQTVRRVAAGPGPPGVAAAPTILAQGRNRGLAAGLNAGLREARRLGFTVFLLLDQDSLLLPGAVAALRVQYHRSPSGASAVLLAAQNELPSSSRAHELLERYLYGYASGPAAPRPGRLALTSGLLLNARTLDLVGGFDESMFVDSVDHEFCLRVRAAGIPLVTVPGARIRHELGQPGSVSGDLIGLPLRYGSEDRLYYGTRDTLRTAWRHASVDPFLGTALGAVTSLRILAYWAAGGPTRGQYRAARRGLRDFLWRHDPPQIPRV